MKVEHYHRTWHQNEDLGLSGIRADELEAAMAAGDAAKNRDDPKANSSEAQHLVRKNITTVSV